ncbi:H-NS histone family protein [Litorisediminicola beolgyonensis]|uniref:H-NS family nucleoid-associated regulatory protein n=1 Tax=Litorisediminicola beolgyonensis TaxID=1173614 RepID=A0ABW3ZEK4_9RHOB
MAIDLEKMSKDELKQLRSDVDKALKTVEARRRAEAKRAADAVAKEYGFSLDELITADGKGGKGVPKYANPSDPTQTWTGRGRKPNWVNESLANGASLDDLKI